MMGPILISIYIFVLAIFVGIGLFSKVPPVLRTPLISGLNAISGITLVGAILSTGTGHSTLCTILGTLAVVAATINVVGGFRLTDRILDTFCRTQKAEKGRNKCRH